MKKQVTIRNITIGEGIPKICVPIVSESIDGILAQAESCKRAQADLVEWRADFFEEIEREEIMLQTLSKLRGILVDIPLLFTFRTLSEGGNRAITAEDYLKMNESVICSGKVDLIDVEVFLSEEVTKKIVHIAHENNIYVVGSNHDFHKTPEKQEIIKRLIYMQELQVDIPKIAVMPNSKADVLELLSATSEMSELYADRPIITMSMDKVGLVSRVVGETFGSAVTFGAVEQVSAPGQMPVEKLRSILEQLH